MSSYQHTPPPATPPTNGLAVASLIVGILGVTAIQGIGPIVALILGYMARGQIRDSQGAMGGEGLAKAGIILGWIGVGLAALWVILGLLGMLGAFGTFCGLSGCTLLMGGSGGY